MSAPYTFCAGLFAANYKRSSSFRNLPGATKDLELYKQFIHTGKFKRSFILSKNVTYDHVLGYCSALNDEIEIYKLKTIIFPLSCHGSLGTNVHNEAIYTEDGKKMPLKLLVYNILKGTNCSLICLVMFCRTDRNINVSDTISMGSLLGVSDPCVIPMVNISDEFEQLKRNSIFLFGTAACTLLRDDVVSGQMLLRAFISAILSLMYEAQQMQKDELCLYEIQNRTINICMAIDSKAKISYSAGMNAGSYNAKIYNINKYAPLQFSAIVALVESLTGLAIKQMSFLHMEHQTVTVEQSVVQQVIQPVIGVWDWIRTTVVGDGDEDDEGEQNTGNRAATIGGKVRKFSAYTYEFILGGSYWSDDDIIIILSQVSTGKWTYEHFNAFIQTKQMHSYCKGLFSCHELIVGLSRDYFGRYFDKKQKDELNSKQRNILQKIGFKLISFECGNKKWIYNNILWHRLLFGDMKRISKWSKPLFKNSLHWIAVCKTINKKCKTNYDCTKFPATYEFNKYVYKHIWEFNKKQKDWDVNQQTGKCKAILKTYSDFLTYGMITKHLDIEELLVDCLYCKKQDLTTNQFYGCMKGHL
eukprot:55289_1